MSFAQKIACAALAIAAAAAAHAAPTPAWTLVVLPTLTDNGGTARAVNNRGDIAGTSNVAPNYGHPVLWSNGTVTDLLAGNPTYGGAEGINDQGAVVMMERSGIVVWKDGATTSLGIAGFPSEINKSGGVAGTYFTGGEIGAGEPHGFYWRDGVLHDIGTLGNHQTWANGVNDKGVVVGFSVLPFSSTSHAVVWEDGVLRDLGTLGGTNSYAMDVNNHGLVVGTSDVADGSFWMFTSSTTGGMTPILQWFVPTAVNDRGQIVGNNVHTGHALLYDNGVVTDLSTVASAQGWTSFAPFALNERGWIVGVAYRPGSTSQGTPVALIPENGGGKPRGG